MRISCHAVNPPFEFVAERIDSLTPRPRIYPWEHWTDGGAWRIRRGEDFEVPATSMAAMVRLRAKSEGLTATCRVVDEDTVEFRFAPLEEAA